MNSLAREFDPTGCGAIDGRAQHFRDGLDAAGIMLSRAARAKGIKRENLRAALAAVLGRDISMAALNGYIAPACRCRMPGDVLIALCLLLDQKEALDEALRSAGWCIADLSEQALADLGRIQLEKESLAAREKRARETIINGGM